MVHLVVEQKASLLSCKKHTNEQRFVTLAATFSLSVRACVRVRVYAHVKLVFREWPLVHRGGERENIKNMWGLESPKKMNL